jgi:hypothetical protein
MSHEQVIAEAAKRLPKNVAKFIALYNDEETREEAKVLFALGFTTQREDLCGND